MTPKQHTSWSSKGLNMLIVRSPTGSILKMTFLLSIGAISVLCFGQHLLDPQGSSLSQCAMKTGISISWRACPTQRHYHPLLDILLTPLCDLLVAPENRLLRGCCRVSLWLSPVKWWFVIELETETGSISKLGWPEDGFVVGDRLFKKRN